MKLAIIEDEKSHADLLESYLRSWGEKRREPLEVAHFPNAESFLFCWEEQSDFDVLFVDIQMRAMNGMDMARKIREKDSHTVIVFTTGISDYMEEGYEVEALRYLLKPISADKVRACMDKVLDRRKTGRAILVHTLEEVIKIPLREMNYIEAQGHGCAVETVMREGGHLITRRYEVLESISELEKQIDSEDFIKCHRSYLCRIENIHHIDKTEIYFDNGSHIPVSRRLYASVNQAFIRFFKKMGE